MNKFISDLAFSRWRGGALTQQWTIFIIHSEENKKFSLEMKIRGERIMNIFCAKRAYSLSYLYLLFFLVCSSLQKNKRRWIYMDTHTITALFVVLVFIIMMWDKIVASVMSMGFVLGALAIVLGATFVFSKLFRINM